MRKINTILLSAFLSLLFSINGSGQSFDWVKSTNVFISSIAADDSSNSYITGCYRNNATLENFTLNSTGYEDFFIAKINSKGNVAWIKTGGGTDASTFGSMFCGNKIRLDKSNNIYVTGYFNDTVTFEGNTLQSLNNEDIFLCKLDNSGNLKWIKQTVANNKYNDQGTSIDINSIGEIYISGSLGDSITFDTITIHDTNIAIISEGFIAKYSKDGNAIWAKTIPGFSADALKVGHDGNIYVGGENDQDSPFVTKISPNGDILWTFNGSMDPNNDAPNAYTSGIDVDHSGNVFAVGYYYQSVIFGDQTFGPAGSDNNFLIKLNSSGQKVFAKQLSNGYFSDIVVDSLDNFYITTGITGTTFEGQSFTNNGGLDVIVARYNNDGEIQWVANAGGNGNDNGKQITVNNWGNVFIYGETESSSASFGTFTVSGPTSIISKLNQTPTVLSYTLIDADDNSDIGLITNGETIDLSSLPTKHLNIRANTDPPFVGSVVFEEQSAVYSDTIAPYSLFGDTDGDYTQGTLPMGTQTLTATAYSTTHQDPGTSGPSYSITFNVTDSGILSVTTPENNIIDINAYPNPSSGPVNIELSSNETLDITIEILNSNGLLVSKPYKGEITSGGNQKIDLNLPLPGIYFCKVYSSKAILAQRKIVFIK